MPSTARNERLSAACVTAALLAGALLVGSAAAQDTERIERLNAGFLTHLEGLAPEQAQAVAHIRQSWQQEYRTQAPESFVPDALAVLYPAFRAVLDAFDEEHYENVVRLATPLGEHGDPYVVANAAYYHARALIEQGLLERAEQQLNLATAAGAEPERYTPYAPHIWFFLGFCQASNLRLDQAALTLQHMLDAFPEAPERVRVGAQQLLLELRRRGTEELDEIARLLKYAAERLKASDGAEKVQERQRRAVALLDKLIEEEERKENKQCGGGQQRGRAPEQAPRRGAEKSEAPDGAGRIGDLHGVEQADPGEMWGKLPPAEREKVLQSLRERYPSRYRQLVEQYYRSLAEEK
ncbi:MAG: hypothetical protein KKB50_18765 [Planctomycetes bacterium]|nr:hypothetical protein [Planctomycetota bacterium]